MQLKEGMHLAGARLFLSTPTDPLQLIAKALTLGVHLCVGPILRMHPGKHTRGQHRRRVACAFLIGEIRHNDRMLRLHAQIIQRADQLQPAQHTQHAIILATRRLRVQMAAHIDRQRVRVRPLAPREHVAHLVQPHGASRILAPALEQRAALGICIRQRLPVVAARDTRPNLRHLHQAVPEAVGVDLEVLSGGGHREAPSCCFHRKSGGNFLPFGKVTIASGFIPVKNCFRNIVRVSDILPDFPAPSGAAL